MTSPENDLLTGGQTNLVATPKFSDNKGKTLLKVSDRLFGRKTFSFFYAYVVIGCSNVNRGLLSVDGSN